MGLDIHTQHSSERQRKASVEIVDSADITCKLEQFLVNDQPLTALILVSYLATTDVVLLVPSVFAVFIFVCARLAMPGSTFQHPGHDPWRVEYGPDEVKKDQNARDGRCIGHLVFQEWLTRRDGCHK
jgi:hypothetical protein